MSGTDILVGAETDKNVCSTSQRPGRAPASGGSTEELSGKPIRSRPRACCSGMLKFGSSTRAGDRGANGPRRFSHPAAKRSAINKNRRIGMVSFRLPNSALQLLSNHKHPRTLPKWKYSAQARQGMAFTS
jgi:hypothetical protein